MALNKSVPKVLFFLVDGVASEAELEAIDALAGAKVMPRNAQLVLPGDRPEAADAVAALDADTIPEQYADYERVGSYAEARAKAPAKKAATPAKAKGGAPVTPPAVEAEPAPDAGKAPATPPAPAWGSN